MNSSIDKGDQIHQLVACQCDRLKTLGKTLENFKKDSELRKTKSYFQFRFAKLNELQRAFSETHHQLLNIATLDEEYFKQDKAIEFDELYLETMCELTDKQESLHVVQPTTSSFINSDTTTISNASNAPMFTQYQSMLPLIPVTPFSGQYIDWPSFHDAFTRLVHLDFRLNPIQKFQFLKQNLPANRDIDIHQM